MEQITNEEAHRSRLEKATKSKVVARAAAIIDKHFTEAIHDKEVEIDAINSSILEAQKALHLIRYGSVTQTYASFTDINSSEVESLHPATKALVDGKRPRRAKATNSESSHTSEDKDTDHPPETSISVDDEPAATSEISNALNHQNASVTTSQQSTSCSEGLSNTTPTPILNVDDGSELPGYVPPSASNIEVDAAENAREPRGHQYKFKRRFVIGNVSKWIECDQREDSSTHKWMLYVRGCKKFPDVSNVVSKVRFFIKHTYAPSNVTHPPYQLISIIERSCFS